VGDEDLEAIYDLGERDSLVTLPVANCLGALSEDDIVVLLALVVNLGLASVSTSHLDGSEFFSC